MKGQVRTRGHTVTRGHRATRGHGDVSPCPCTHSLQVLHVRGEAREHGDVDDGHGGIHVVQVPAGDRDEATSLSLVPGVPVPSSPVPLPVSDVPAVPNTSDVPNISDVPIVSHLVQMVILTERMMPSGSLPVRGHKDTAATRGGHGRNPGGQ